MLETSQSCRQPDLEQTVKEALPMLQGASRSIVGSLQTWLLSALSERCHRASSASFGAELGFGIFYYVLPYCRHQRLIIGGSMNGIVILNDLHGGENRNDDFGAEIFKVGRLSV